MSLKTFFEDTLASFGIGGLYLHKENYDCGRDRRVEKITGPFSRRSVAQGPLWTSISPADLGMILKVKYHFRPPKGAIKQSTFEVR